MLPILLEYMECGYSTTILGEISNGLTSSAIQLHPEINETLAHCQPFFLSLTTSKASSASLPSIASPCGVLFYTPHSSLLDALHLMFSWWSGILHTMLMSLLISKLDSLQGKDLSGRYGWCF
jgi:hypothetical protein